MGKNTFLISAFLLAVALSIPGCETKKMYSGPERPRDEIAVIKPHTGIFSPGIIIAAVDGKKPGFADAAFAVEPGTHTLAVNLLSCTTTTLFVSGSVIYVPTCNPPRVKVLTLDAEAGHTYIVHGEFASGRAAYWIVDEQTKQVVAGTKPG